MSKLVDDPIPREFVLRVRPSTDKRGQELQAALVSATTFRALFSGRPRDSAQWESDLWDLLLREMQGKARRSFLKRIHGALCTLRQRREWAVVEKAIPS